jgi:hypothetical protein
MNMAAKSRKKSGQPCKNEDGQKPHRKISQKKEEEGFRVYLCEFIKFGLHSCIDGLRQFPSTRFGHLNR